MTRKSKKTSRQLRRGYLLVEAMVSTSIMAATLAGTIHLMGNARAHIAQARKVDVANTLAQQKANELLGQPQDVVSGNDVPQQGFQRSWSESQSGIVADMRDADTLHQIVVTVRYFAENNVQKQLRYQVYKREKRYN